MKAVQLLTLGAATAAALVFAQSRSVSDAEVKKVHQSALLIDTHNDITSRTVDGFDINSHSTETHTDLARMKQGGMGAQFFAVFVAADYARRGQAAHRTLEMIDTVKHDIVERYPSQFQFATTADEVVAAHKAGKIAALMGIEGGHAIEDSLRLLRQFHALGIRYMTLTHSNTNNWADSSGDMDRSDVKHHNGLTAFGKEVVQEMNRLSMIVDIAHVADKTFWDALETSRAPIFSSHSSCRALSTNKRNMTDEMITAMAKKGGVIQINFSCDYLSQKTEDASKALPPITGRMAELREKYKDDPKAGRAAMMEIMRERRQQIPPAQLADVVSNIDHVAKLAGVDAVGLGSDFDGVGCVPVGLATVAEWPNLTRALLEKGYSAEDIRKIYGGNTLRLMRAVEKVARESKPAS